MSLSFLTGYLSLSIQIAKTGKKSYKFHVKEKQKQIERLHNSYKKKKENKRNWEIIKCFNFSSIFNKIIKKILGETTDYSKLQQISEYFKKVAKICNLLKKIQKCNFFNILQYLQFLKLQKFANAATSCKKLQKIASTFLFVLP